jgi:hypothetical protein
MQMTPNPTTDTEQLFKSFFFSRSTTVINKLTSKLSKIISYKLTHILGKLGTLKTRNMEEYLTTTSACVLEGTSTKMSWNNTTCK